MIPDLERWFMMTMNGTRMETINNMLQPEGMQIEMKEFFKNNTTTGFSNLADHIPGWLFLVTDRRANRRRN